MTFEKFVAIMKSLGDRPTYLVDGRGQIESTTVDGYLAMVRENRLPPGAIASFTVESALRLAARRWARPSLEEDPTEPGYCGCHGVGLLDCPRYQVRS